MVVEQSRVVSYVVQGFVELGLPLYTRNVQGVRWLWLWSLHVKMG